jgi:hypothetical protein
MKRKRIPPHLSPEQRDEFLKLQARWDQKLRDDGFKDIEDGWDTNEYSSSTLRGGDPARQGVTFVAIEPEDDDRPHTAVADEPAAVYWRLFASAAHALPQNYPRRALILAVAEAGILRKELLHRHHLSYDAALGTVERFCAKAEIPRPQFRASPTKRAEELPPPPVRKLGTAEVRFLQHTSPARTMSAEALERLRSKKKAAA